MKNNNSPQETVNAQVVAKRMKVVTFELENGTRLELGVKDPEYGMLAEGDRGRLSYQGTRYLGFERI